jgi:mRNA interferase HigB
MREDHGRPVLVHDGTQVWRNEDVRQSFPGTDPVKVASGKTVYVFNLIGNAYRMICAIHFNTGKVFMLRFMTHANYSKEKWKNEL